MDWLFRFLFISIGIFVFGCHADGKCPDGYYGKDCSTQCSTNCAHEKRFCDKATGECFEGCRQGFHGPRCNLNCSSLCRNNTCVGANGDCMGCIDGYELIANECKLKTTIETTKGSTRPDTYSDSGAEEETQITETTGADVLGIVVPVAVVVVVMVVVVVVAVVKRKRKSRKRCSKGNADEIPLRLSEDLNSDGLAQYERDRIKDLRGLKSDGLAQYERDRIKDLRDRAKVQVKKFTEGMVHIEAVDTVVKKIIKEEKMWITITGNAGDGKTTLGYLVLREFQSKMRVYNIIDPREYWLLCKLKEERIILFDDRFGAFTADRYLVNNWVKVIKHVMDLHNNSSRSEKQTRVIFVSRLNVVRESQDFLDNYREKLLDPDSVIDLSTKKIITEERMKILDYYCKKENVRVTDEVKRSVVGLKTAHGFPFCCKMYSVLKAKGIDMDIKEFFQSPLKFLDSTTEVLYKANCKELFELLAEGGGKFDVLSVEDKEKRRKLLKIVQEQTGGYIMYWRDYICMFSHPAVFESVLNVLNDFDPLYCVQHAPLDIIKQKVIISKSKKEDEQKAPCHIIIKPVGSVLKMLAGRFYSGILDGEYSIFQHRLCENKDFCEMLVTSSTCQDSDKGFKDGKRFIDQPGKDQKTMLWTALESGNTTALHVLVRHGANVNIKDRQENTPLHFLCQHSNCEVDIDTLKFMITEGHGDADSADAYGRTPLHLLCEHGSINLEAMKCLVVEGKCDVNKADTSGNTPLHYLCRQENTNVDAIQWIITEGSGDINKHEQNRSTPLHHLSVKESMDVTLTCFLIKRGDFNKGDEFGSTPLHFLCGKGNERVDAIRETVYKGDGDVNKRDHNGITPLHYLCRGSADISFIRSLIMDGKGNINQADQNGNTPVHYLCRRKGLNRNDVMEIPGADVKITNKLGHSPLDYSCEGEDERIAWTEGILDRSTTDLVICKQKIGGDLKHVLGKTMELIGVQEVKMKDKGRMLTNIEIGDSGTEHRKRFMGAHSSLINASSSSLSTAIYYENNVWIRWKDTAHWPIFEIGLVDMIKNLDMGLFVSVIERSWCISVRELCSNHQGHLCIGVFSECQSGQ